MGRDLSKISKQRNVIQDIGNILYDDANNLLLCLFIHKAGMWSMRMKSAKMLYFTANFLFFFFTSHMLSRISVKSLAKTGSLSCSK